MSNDSIQFKINWIRHAESCANYDSGIVIDKETNPDRAVGYDKLIELKELKELKESKDRAIYGKHPLYATFYYEPNLSYNGMQQAILLGMNYIYPQYKKKKYNYVLCSALSRTIMTTLLAFRRIPDCTIIVVPYITEEKNISGKVGYDNQNTPVPSAEIKRKILFFKDWLENSWLENYDDIEVIYNIKNFQESFTTIYDKFQKFYINKNDEDSEKIKKIINKLNERTSDIIDNRIERCKPDEKKKDDYPCQYKPQKLKTKTIINEIIKIYNEFDEILKVFAEEYFIKYSTSDGTSEIDNIKKKMDINIEFFKDILKVETLRGPPVKISIIEEFEKKEGTYDIKPDFNKFITLILEQELNVKNNELVCVTTHGGMLKHYILDNSKDYIENEERNYYSSDTEYHKYDEKITENIRNTDVFQETLVIHQDNEKNKFLKKKRIVHKMIQLAYPAPLIRHEFEKFEIVNADICRLESVKGFLNSVMTLKNEEKDKEYEKYKEVYPFLIDHHGYFYKSYNRNNYQTWNEDLKFVKEKTNKDYLSEKIPKIIEGGYKEKYIKYKTKYLQLKSQNKSNNV